jgi:Phosphotransferase enzyme family
MWPWREAGRKLRGCLLMSLTEAANVTLTPEVTDLLHQAGLGHVRFELIPLSGGANNQVYRIELGDRAPLVLKRYFFSPEDRRDRFHSEKSFYDFISAVGVQGQTARALGWDRERRLGLLSWIEGRRLQAEEVDRAAIDQALGFYFALNAEKERPEAATIPNASEACFDLKEHFACVERRLARLATVDEDSILGAEAIDFISRRLRPVFEEYQQAQAGAEMAPLAADERCLSPSDFGFHNTFRQSDGKLVFFDFEYAGWDDPAKFLCDFLCQPAMPVPRALWDYCVKAVCTSAPGGSKMERIALLLPLYQLKWCCIMLNEFLPREQSRRVFSQKLSPPEMEAKKREQLAKAGNLLEKVIRFDLTQNRGLDGTITF